MFASVVQTHPLLRHHQQLLHRSLSPRSTLSARLQHRRPLLQQRLLRTVSPLVSPRVFLVRASLQTELRRHHHSRLAVVLVLVLVPVVVHRLSTSLLVLVKAIATHSRVCLRTAPARRVIATGSPGSRVASSTFLPLEDRVLPSNLCLPVVLVVVYLELLLLLRLRLVPRLLRVLEVSLVPVLRAQLPVRLR